jgi:hypothetical protein
MFGSGRIFSVFVVTYFDNNTIFPPPNKPPITGIVTKHTPAMDQYFKLKLSCVTQDVESIPHPMIPWTSAHMGSDGGKETKLKTNIFGAMKNDTTCTASRYDLNPRPDMSFYPSL